MPNNPDQWRDFSPIRSIVAKKFPYTSHLRSNFFKGPNKEVVPFSINRSDKWGEDDELVGDYRFRFIRVGNLGILDHNLKPDIPQETLKQFSDNLVWLWRFRSVFCEPTHLQYSPLTIHALSTMNLTGKHVLDLGAADGIQSLTAMKLGAGRTTAVELNPEYFPYFAHHQKVNEFDEQKMDYLFGDLADHDKIISDIESPTPDIAVANIGPWYKGNPHLEAIKLAAKIPSIKTFIAGAYIKDHPDKNHLDSLELLQSLGFKTNYRELLSEGVCLAFMIDREDPNSEKPDPKSLQPPLPWI